AFPAGRAFEFCVVVIETKLRVLRTTLGGDWRDWIIAHALQSQAKDRHLLALVTRKQYSLRDQFRPQQALFALLRRQLSQKARPPHLLLCCARNFEGCKPVLTYVSFVHLLNLLSRF